MSKPIKATNIVHELDLEIRSLKSTIAERDISIAALKEDVERSTTNWERALLLVKEERERADKAESERDGARRKVCEVTARTYSVGKEDAEYFFERNRAAVLCGWDPDMLFPKERS